MNEILEEEKELLSELKMNFCKYTKSVLEDFQIKFPCEPKEAETFHELEIIYHKDICEELQKIYSKIKEYKDKDIIELILSTYAFDLNKAGYYDSIYLLYISPQELNKRWQKYKKLSCFF